MIGVCRAAQACGLDRRRRRRLGRGHHQQRGTGGTARSRAPRHSCGRSERARSAPDHSGRGGAVAAIVGEIEDALSASGVPIFSRAGMLVEPVSEKWPQPMGARPYRQAAAPVRRFAAGADRRGRGLPEFQPQTNAWLDIDPPLQLVRMMLRANGNGPSPRERNHHHPDVARRWVAARGARLRSSIGAVPAAQPAVRPSPSIRPRSRPGAALDMLIDLLSEFPFARARGDRSFGCARRATDCPCAWLAADRAGDPGARRYARDRQELPRRSLRHDQYRPALSGHHRLEECRGDGEKAQRCAPGAATSSRSTTSCMTSPANCSASSPSAP